MALLIRIRTLNIQFIKILFLLNCLKLKTKGLVMIWFSLTTAIMNLLLIEPIKYFFEHKFFNLADNKMVYFIHFYVAQNVQSPRITEVSIILSKVESFSVKYRKKPLPRTDIRTYERVGTS